MPINIQSVSSIEQPELEPFRTLKRPLEHQQQGIFIAEGEKVIRRLLASQLRVLSILLTPEWFGVYRPLLEPRSEMIEVYLSEKNEMETIVGFPLHKGIMAKARIPERRTVNDVVASSTRPFFFAAVDGIMNSENLGVIVRNCASFGVQGLLVGETSCDPYLRRAVRNSMGNIFLMPIAYCIDIAKELQELRASFGVTVVAAHPREEAREIGQIDFSGDCCIVLGNEGHGISENVLAVCDSIATIPMKKGVDSINVGSASAVFLYEVQRQRRQK